MFSRSLHLQSECQNKDGELSVKEETIRKLSLELTAIKEQRNQTQRDLQKLEKSYRSIQKELSDEQQQHKYVSKLAHQSLVRDKY